MHRLTSLLCLSIPLLAACAKSERVATALAAPDVATALNMQAVLAADVAPTPDPPPVAPDQFLVPLDSGAPHAGQPTEAFTTPDQLTADAEVRAVLDEMAAGQATKAMADRLRARKAVAGQALARALWSDNPNLRSKAATMLAEIEPEPTPEIAAALSRSLLAEPMASTRAATARALVDYKVEATIPALIETIGKDTDENARSHGCYALGAMRARQALPALVRAAQDPESWVRIRAVTALGRIGGKEAAAAIQRASKDPNSVVRDAAARARKRH